MQGPSGDIRDFQDIKSFSRIERGRTECRIAFEFLAILSLALLHHFAVVPFWTLPLVLILISSRQHALLVLMHEGVHRRISKHRFWNDLVSELIAWQFLMSMQGYRRHHVLHHKIENLNTALDPDWLRKQKPEWVFPMKRFTLAKILLGDVLLMNTADFYHEAKDAKNNLVNTDRERHWKWARLSYLVILASALILSGYWKLWLLYWVVPIFSFTKAILRIRSIADHFGIPNERQSNHPFSRTRTILGSLPERILLAPCSIGVHGTHHYHSGIPYYRLRAAHSYLMKKSESYVQYGKFYSTYYKALNECLNPPAPQVDRLKSDSDLELYRSETAKHVGVEYPMAYLREARVYALRKSDGTILGGFAFVAGCELRTVQSLPVNLQSRVLSGNYVELTGLWLAPESFRPFTVIHFWLALSWAAVPFVRKKLIFTFSSSKLGLKKMYSVLKPDEIYHGTVPILQGMTGEDIESINETPCFRLAFLPVLNPNFYWNRIRVRRFRVS